MTIGKRRTINEKAEENRTRADRKTRIGHNFPRRSQSKPNANGENLPPSPRNGLVDYTEAELLAALNALQRPSSAGNSRPLQQPRRERRDAPLLEQTEPSPLAKRDEHSTAIARAAEARDISGYGAPRQSVTIVTTSGTFLKSALKNS